MSCECSRDLKYGPDDEDVIRKITRASKPGKRLIAHDKQLILILLRTPT